MGARNKRRMAFWPQPIEFKLIKSAIDRDRVRSTKSLSSCIAKQVFTEFKETQNGALSRGWFCRYPCGIRSVQFIYWLARTTALPRVPIACKFLNDCNNYDFLLYVSATSYFVVNKGGSIFLLINNFDYIALFISIFIPVSYSNTSFGYNWRIT